MTPFPFEQYISHAHTCSSVLYIVRTHSQSLLGTSPSSSATLSPALPRIPLADSPRQCTALSSTSSGAHREGFESNLVQLSLQAGKGLHLSGHHPYSPFLCQTRSLVPSPLSTALPPSHLGVRPLTLAPSLKVATGKEAIFLELDLSSLASVKKSAQEFLRKEHELHILFNNA